jgi:hypothetical protein
MVQASHDRRPIEAVERLDGRLFIDGEHGRVVGPIEV